MLDRVLIDDYFEWLCNFINDDQSRIDRYWKLLRLLYQERFTVLIPMDSNRAQDGLDMRDRYVDTVHNGNVAVRNDLASYLDGYCSILEMMVALSDRCEIDIMGNDSLGDRRPKWFWTMIRNLGLDDMDDRHFDSGKVLDAVDIFLNREYSYDGSHGGLFVVRHPRKDMRNAEIWYQMLWYLDEEGE